MGNKVKINENVCVCCREEHEIKKIKKLKVGDNYLSLCPNCLNDYKKILSDAINEASNTGFKKGVDESFKKGIEIGKFYQKHNITDNIPKELEKEFNELFGKFVD